MKMRFIGHFRYMGGARAFSSKVGNFHNLIAKTYNFADKHIGPDESEQQLMLNTLGFKSLEELSDAVIPEKLRFRSKLHIESIPEIKLLEEARRLGDKNKQWRSYVGLGYYNCHTPNVIRRNMIENAAWTTPYTPYQAEISQGRLESLFNFQSMVTDLTGLPVANASLLDEATAVAEAVTLACRKTNRNRILLSRDIHPQTLSVVQTRMRPLGVHCEICDVNCIDWQNKKNLAAVVIQYPDTNGRLIDYSQLASDAHHQSTLVICATDLLCCAIAKPPGVFGADVAVGSSQRFGVPLGFGGPHAAFFATTTPLVRFIPGRMVGKTRDANGGEAFRLALQTREQHIRREKATSNVCTAQALLANVAAMYAVYHGPEGIANIATAVHNYATSLNNALTSNGNISQHAHFFDTLKITPKESLQIVKKRAEEKQINLRYFDDHSIGISLDETVTIEDLNDIANIFNPSCSQKNLLDCESTRGSLPPNLKRESSYLSHAVFQQYHSETKLARYMKRLENKDISLVHSMIPLGSCTMKLNSSASLSLLSEQSFNSIHPFVPADQYDGYSELMEQLASDLCHLTGYDSVSFQPNSGAQGEYAGLLAIRLYHEQRGERNRRVCLIPSSAHGTNPASAKMAGMTIVPLAGDKYGRINMQNLAEKVEEHASNLSCLMITYPSTNGIFEGTLADICNVVHKHGGQVFLDGANLNAQIGLIRPGEFADVSHLNLHKTFSIPHGGGGPGVGPVILKKHLAQFLPSHPHLNTFSENVPTISAAPFGSASILPISWAYIKMMGGDGLKKASQVAILNANYIRKRLEAHYPILYVGGEETGAMTALCAHEFILDARQFASTAGIEAVDIAKRLMDFGFHAPTMSWPVAGTLMIEPTESEDKDELDRFCDALLKIRDEIRLIENGAMSKSDNPLKMSPHTEACVTANQWNHPYTRQQAAFPLNSKHVTKIWPAVGRVDDAFGDKNLVCSCS